MCYDGISMYMLSNACDARRIGRLGGYTRHYHGTTYGIAKCMLSNACDAQRIGRL